MTKTTKEIVTIGILSALYVVLSATIKIPFIGNIALDMGYIVLTVAAVCCGSIPAAIVGGIGCAIESILFTALGFSISWVVMNIIIGLIVGYVANREVVDNKKWILLISIPIAVLIGVTFKTAIECVLYSIPVAVKIPKALVAFAVDSVVMLIGVPIAYRVKKIIKQ